jgi:Trp operon repressor
MMDKRLVDKLGCNALILERLTKLSQLEKQKVVVRLLMTRSERQLGEELGVCHSTIHDWRSGRQDNTAENIHVSLAVIKRKLENFKPEDSDDIVKLHEIKNIIERILGEGK